MTRKAFVAAIPSRIPALTADPQSLVAHYGLDGSYEKLDVEPE